MLCPVPDLDGIMQTEVALYNKNAGESRKILSPARCYDFLIAVLQKPAEQIPSQCNIDTSERVAIEPDFYLFELVIRLQKKSAESKNLVGACIPVNL